MAGLDVKVWRYGMPWRLTEPAPGEYDWSLWDRALAACERHGLEPVVDLCHFGLPDHYRGFCDPEWLAGFTRYADAFLHRFPGPRWFTPVNEPFVTALNSGRLGLWNDRRTSRADFAAALCHCALANLEVAARVRADRGGWWIGSEGFTCPVALETDQLPHAQRIRATAQAVWDLQLGVPLRDEVAADFDRVDEAIRSRIEALATTENVIAGHDVYPVSVMPVGGNLDAWTIQDRLAAYEAEARAWYDRYRVDFWVAETSNLGLPVAEQVAWLDSFSERLAAMRSSGLPVRGLCWYSRGDQFDWDTGLTRPVGRVTEVGLFGADRRPRRVAAVFRSLAASGAPR